VYALVIAVASSAVASSIARQALQDKRQYMGDYMKARKMPSELREKIRDLFAIKFENGQYVKNKALLLLLLLLLLLQCTTTTAIVAAATTATASTTTILQLLLQLLLPLLLLLLATN